MAEIAAMPNAIDPIITGMLSDPGGATKANKAGSNAVMGGPRVLCDGHSGHAGAGLEQLRVEAREDRVVALVDEAPHQQRHDDRQRHAMDADGVEIAEGQQARDKRANDHRRAAANPVGQVADEGG